MFFTHVLHNRSTNFCILVIFHTFFTLISLKVFKLKVKVKKILIYWFSMGIDHSNPYIHSTTLLCDMHTLKGAFVRDIIFNDTITADSSEYVTGYISMEY